MCCSHHTHTQYAIYTCHEFLIVDYNRFDVVGSFVDVFFVLFFFFFFSLFSRQVYVKHWKAALTTTTHDNIGLSIFGIEYVCHVMFIETAKISRLFDLFVNIINSEAPQPLEFYIFVSRSSQNVWCFTSTVYICRLYYC